MKENIKIEIATEKDLKMYRDLRRLAITGKDKEMFGSTPEMVASEDNRPEKEWLEDITSPERFIVLAWGSGEPVGMGSVIKKEEAWYMRSFFVREDFRNMGAGKSIWEAGLKEIQRRGGKKVFLHVRNGNDIPKHIFESFGFKKTKDDDTAGVGYFMELTL